MLYEFQLFHLEFQKIAAILEKWRRTVFFPKYLFCGSLYDKSSYVQIKQNKIFYNSFKNRFFFVKSLVSEYGCLKIFAALAALLDLPIFDCYYCVTVCKLRLNSADCNQILIISMKRVALTCVFCTWIYDSIYKT